VIFLRPKLDAPANRIKLVMAVIANYEDKLKDSFIVVSEDKIRIKKI